MELQGRDGPPSKKARRTMLEDEFTERAAPASTGVPASSNPSSNSTRKRSRASQAGLESTTPKDPDGFAGTSILSYMLNGTQLHKFLV